MFNRLKVIAIASFALCVMVLPITSNAPAWADSPPVLNENSNPATLNKVLSKLNGLIAQNKADEKIYGSKAQILEWLKDNKSAANAYSKAIELSPHNGLYFLGRARSYRKFQNHSKAVIDYSKAIDLGKKTSEAYTGRALSRLGLANYKGAISDASAAISIDSSEQLAWYAKGSAEAYLGRFSKSISSLTRAIKLNPSDPIFLLRRSQVYKKLGYESKASKDLLLSRKFSK